jgi:hypothetical protein
VIFEDVKRLIGVNLEVESINLRSSILLYVHMAGIENALTKLRSLPTGWDGYRGIPVTEVVSRRVHALLAAILLPVGRYPSLVPGSRGEVQVEWHSYGVDLEIEVAESGHALGFLKVGDTEMDFIVKINESGTQI